MSDWLNNITALSPEAKAAKKRSDKAKAGAPFWMVWCDQPSARRRKEGELRTWLPYFRHGTLQSANVEARRVSEMFPKSKTYVMQPKRAFRAGVSLLEGRDAQHFALEQAKTHIGADPELTRKMIFGNCTETREVDLPALDEEGRLAILTTIAAREDCGLYAAEEVANLHSLPNDIWGLVMTGLRGCSDADHQFIWTMPALSGPANAT